MDAPQDSRYMKLAIKEARKGMGRTSPNPAVGAVVVKDGRIVAKGYHKKAGTPHAEVNALRRAGDDASGATIYVTLEPCNHQGRTPPCTAAIVAADINRVVVGMADPNPHVKGGGSDFLRRQGIEVVEGVLEKECRELNRPFIKHISTGLPWVMLKAGMSIDGRIATRTGHSNWITNAGARRHVHRIRNRVDAILVGIGTALSDDPSLTARGDGMTCRDPLRVILDKDLRLPVRAKMLTQQSEAATWIFCGPDADANKRKALAKAGATIWPVEEEKNGGVNIHAVLKKLGENNIQSVLVEGGGRIHGSFLRHGQVDEALFFIAPMVIGAAGVPVVNGLSIDKIEQAVRFNSVTSKRIDDNILLTCRF